MLLATFHRTADSRRDAPTPMIAPVIVCVVDTGPPSQVAPNSVIAPPVSAQKPCAGVSRVIFDPLVWTIRHPPATTPSPKSGRAACRGRGGQTAYISVSAGP